MQESGKVPHSLLKFSRGTSPLDKLDWGFELDHRQTRVFDFLGMQMDWEQNYVLPHWDQQFYVQEASEQLNMSWTAILAGQKSQKWLER